MTSVERAFPALLQDFFHRRLVAQRGASAHHDRQLPRHLHVVSRVRRRAHRTDALGIDP